MEIGDIVWRHDYGVGRIVDIDIYSLTPYLVYFYKEDNRLHDGGGKGPDCHYWLCFKGSLTSCTFSVFVQANRKETQ